METEDPLLFEKMKKKYSTVKPTFPPYEMIFRSSQVENSL